MTKKQLAVLFGISLVNFTVALSALPFLPLYATNYLGADSGQAGIFLAITSATLTAGSIAGGWLSAKLKRRKILLIVSAIIGLPSFLLIAYASNIVQLSILAGIAWFVIGVGTTIVRIIGGILADESERGRIFGIIGAATPLSALISGLVGGRIVDHWNIQSLFVIMSLIFIVQIILVFFMDEIASTDTTEELVPVTQEMGFNLPFWLLIASSFVGFLSLAEIIMGRPLHMDQLGFDATAISGVLIAGGLVSLPFTFLIGWLSDRFGRKNLLLLCYFVAAIGVVILAFSEPLWHFWVSEMFLAFVGISSVVGTALVTDIVPKEGLDSAISRFTASAWMGSIVGFALVGYIIDWVGLATMFGIAAAIMLVAFMTAIPIQQAKAKRA